MRLKTILTVSVLLAAPAAAQDTSKGDHTVTATSTVPVIAGRKSSLYVRERALPGVLKSGADDKVVLFVHGAGAGAADRLRDQLHDQLSRRPDQYRLRLE